MKILHVADLHLDHAWFDWVAGHSSDYDLLVIAGDLQNAFSNSGMHDQARAVTKWLLGISTPTVVCSGNHDYWVGDKRVSADVYAEAAWLKILKGKGSIIGVDSDVIDFQGLRILVNGWLQVPSEGVGPVDIIVTHAPPMDCACACGAEGRDVGDCDLWQSLESPPTLMLCGHIHAPQKHACTWPPLDPTTTVLVPGCDEQSEVPAHWIVDTDAGIATHSSGTSIDFI